MNNYVFGLCEGRHEIPVDQYIFGNSIEDPTDTEGLAVKAANVFASNGIEAGDEVQVYVTGLTVALIAAIVAAKEIGATVVLYHFDRETGSYFPQSV